VREFCLVAPLAHLVAKASSSEWSVELSHKEREVTKRTCIDDPLQFGMYWNFEPNWAAPFGFSCVNTNRAFLMCCRPRRTMSERRWPV
jgi:hypothetical protein